MKFKAVIFDLDGTLLNSLEDISISANNILERHGFPSHTLDRYRYFVGDGIPVLIKRILPEGNFSDEELNQYVDEFRREYALNWNVLSRPYPGIPEMLNELRKRDLKLAVFSNKPHDFTRMCVAELLGDWSFDMVQGLDRDIPPKPDPAGAFRIAESISVPPEQIVFLGDTAVDMRTSLACGMFPAGALWGFRTEEELRGAGAKVLLKEPREFQYLIDNAVHV
jgi:phosphoglycolate phosphatase